MSPAFANLRIILLIGVFAVLGLGRAGAETLEEFYKRVLERKATSADFDPAFAGIIRKPGEGNVRYTRDEMLAEQADEIKGGAKVELLDLRILSRTETALESGGAYVSVVSRARCRGTMNGETEEATAVNHDILFREENGVFRMVALLCYMER